MKIVLSISVRALAVAGIVYVFLIAPVYPAQTYVGPRPAMPNLALTPGRFRNLSIDTVCGTKWGLDRRHVTEQMKAEVCAEYGIKSGCPGPAYEVDHFGPRELAGADEVKNLWVQPITEAREKDRLETFLHRQVCTGWSPTESAAIKRARSLALVAAQHEIIADWWASYQNHFILRRKQNELERGSKREGAGSHRENQTTI